MLTLQGQLRIPPETTQSQDFLSKSIIAYNLTVNISILNFTGQGKPTGFQEQASVVVETVTKTSSMSKFASFAPFTSDASKVTVEGNGIKKGFRNKQCTFNVDCSHAGTYNVGFYYKPDSE